MLPPFIIELQKIPHLNLIVSYNLSGGISKTLIHKKEYIRSENSRN